MNNIVTSPPTYQPQNDVQFMGRCAQPEFSVATRQPTSRTKIERKGQCTYNVTSVLVIGLCAHACGYPGAWACACAYVHVALLIQRAMRMRHVVTSFVAARFPPYFAALSHKLCHFRENVIEYKMCVFIFSTAFV